MAKKILLVLMMTTLAFSATACGKEKDNVVISVGDNGNDSGKNKVTTETNDGTEYVYEENSTESAEPITTNSLALSENDIYGGYTSEAGDVFQFNKDNTYSSYIASTGESSEGTYETDGTSSVTLTCNNVSTDTASEDVSQNFVSEDTQPAYITRDLQDDGQLLVTEYDENNNMINQYTTENTETTEEAPNTESTEKADDKVTLTYKISRTTATNEAGDTFNVLVLTKGDTSYTLTKQYEVSK